MYKIDCTNHVSYIKTKIDLAQCPSCCDRCPGIWQCVLCTKLPVIHWWAHRKLRTP